VIRIEATQEMMQNSQLKASSLGWIDNSILKGGGNRAGYLGEEALASHLDADIVSNNRGRDKYNYDLVLQDGRRMEVKTKRRTVGPRPHYDVSVAQTSSHQRPDLYGFISLQFERTSGKHPKKYYGLKNIWLCGYMPAGEYWERAILWKSGQIDPTNSFKTHVDMYNMAISDLYPDLQTLDNSGKTNEICTPTRPLGI
tara:strand:+ start:960 stop:1553 length:594 start_codon:yes stop_codon:yes gene_type:complete